MASVTEAQHVATDFWQLHAPASCPLGTPLPPPSGALPVATGQAAIATGQADAGGAGAAPAAPGDGRHGRWRIEWRKRGRGRAAAQYSGPPGTAMRAMLLTVADDVSEWQ